MLACTKLNSTHTSDLVETDTAAMMPGDKGPSPAAMVSALKMRQDFFGRRAGCVRAKVECIGAWTREAVQGVEHKRVTQAEMFCGLVMQEKRPLKENGAAAVLLRDRVQLSAELRLLPGETAIHTPAKT